MRESKKLRIELIRLRCDLCQIYKKNNYKSDLNDSDFFFSIFNNKLMAFLWLPIRSKFLFDHLEFGITTTETNIAITDKHIYKNVDHENIFEETI